MIILISNGFAYAHEYPISGGLTDEQMLDFCEFFYEEYIVLGTDLMMTQHAHLPNIRLCIDLYDHIVWNVKHKHRNIILIAEIDKLMKDSTYLKERHLDTFESIPQWIKTDFVLWANEEISETNFAYTLRSMIDLGIISPQSQSSSIHNTCNPETLCILTGDYLIYAKTDNFGSDTITIKHTFEEISPDKIKITEKILSKQGQSTTDFFVNPITGITSLIDEEGQCCQVYSYVKPISKLDVFEDSKIIMKSVMDIDYNFKGETKSAIIAADNGGNQIYTISDDIGILFVKNNESYDLISLWEKIELVETNMFERDSGVQLGELEIPKWWKKNVLRYNDGLISEVEFLTALEYLLENQIIRV